jgi:hypothetical protein
LNGAKRRACARWTWPNALSAGKTDVIYVETGQKLVDVVEMMEWADAIGFDAHDAIKRLYKTPEK